jgi:hypothetical protein
MSALVLNITQDFRSGDPFVGNPAISFAKGIRRIQDDERYRITASFTIASPSNDRETRGTRCPRNRFAAIATTRLKPGLAARDRKCEV